MNVIEVRGTKNPAPAADPAEAYVVRSTDKQAKTKTPYIVGLALMSIVVYLKSIFQSSARTPDEPWAPQPDERQPLANDGIGDGIDAAVLGDQAPLPGLAEGDGGPEPGSGRRLVSLQDPMEFMLVDAPEFDFSSFTTGGPVSFRPAPPPWRGTPANDNGPPAIPVTRGPDKSDGPDGPGGPDGPDGPDKPDEPDGPDGPVNPADPDGPGPEEPCEDDPTRPNRAPRVTGTVCLTDIGGCTMLVIALSDLLRHATDPDGDPLSVRDVTVSSGTIIQSGDGWLFQPAEQFYGAVTISYQVTDGEFLVAQSAHFEVVRTTRIEGSDCDDTLAGTMCADEIDGRDGNDIIDARAGADIVRGGNGDDVIHGGDGDDNLCGGDGNDIIFGGAGDDVIHGGSGKDLLSGGTGNDLIFGDEGDDTLFGDEGDDILHGGEGSDLLAGGEGDDRLLGDDGDDRLFGDDGDDSLSGGDGVDFLDGGAGNDTLDGGDGDDVLSDGAGSDIVEGGEGDDTVIAAADGDDDRFDGGEGTDTIDYSADDDGISVDLDAGIATGAAIGHDTLESFEAVIGGTGNDTIHGSAADETLYGGDGDDVLSDGAGSDIVEGGEGDDMVIAAADGDDDRFDGGEGTDTIDYSATSEGVVIDTVAGLASGCEIGDDTISGFEAYIGGSGDDHLIAGACPTVLTGGDGDDIFEFVAPASPPVPDTAPIAPATVTHAIVDFRPGDIARMSRWDIFEKTMDRLEDHFERIYGDDIDADEVPIRFRYEQYEDVKKTVIEADLNFDDHFETTVLLDGHRAIVITEHC